MATAVSVAFLGQVRLHLVYPLVGADSARGRAEFAFHAAARALATPPLAPISAMR